MIGVNIKSTGFDNMRRKLDKAASDAKKPARFSDYLSARAYKEVIAHFQKEEGPDRKWDSLKPTTIARRRLGGGGAKILRDTGRLYSSISYRGEESKAVVFTNVQYAPTHQDGSKNVPQRKFLWVSNGFLKIMAEAFAKFIKGDMS